MNSFDSNNGKYQSRTDLVCFSHLRWDFVYQRPQHLMSRCARQRRVFFVEEPVFEKDRSKATIETRIAPEGIRVATPRLPMGLVARQIDSVLRRLLNGLFEKNAISDFISWYYTPMALPFSSHLHPSVVVYDCMDDLSGFRGAPVELRNREAELMARADVVFTGGISLYEAKANQHHNIHPFPSSIDSLHFRRAREITDIPAEQSDIPSPRLGFSGVIDERMDLKIVYDVACRRPDWHIVMIGPVVKINSSDLPQSANIHYLGPKPYEQLPSYMAGWNVAIMPFAHNEATRFISPTKTPEYLAAGRPVVSTSIRDVVRVYGALGLVSIADNAHDFISETEKALATSTQETREWLGRVDGYLARLSWDNTWSSMMRHIQDALEARGQRSETVDKSSYPPLWLGTPLGEGDV